MRLILSLNTQNMRISDRLFAGKCVMFAMRVIQSEGINAISYQQHTKKGLCQLEFAVLTLMTNVNWCANICVLSTASKITESRLNDGHWSYYAIKM